MTLGLFCQLCVNGLSVGMIYLLIVLGIDIIMRLTSIMNFAHGQFYMMGAYAFWFTYVVLRFNVVPAILISGAAVVLLGALSYRFVFHVLQRRFSPATPYSFRLLLSAMASVGLMMILGQTAVVSFGTQHRGIPSIFPQTIGVGHVSLSVERVVVILIGILLVIGLFLLLFKTKIGKAMRAVSSNAEVSSLLGINTASIYLIGFALGAGLAGLAGVIIAPLFAVSTEMGNQIIFMAFMVMVVGGIGSYKGSILGSLLIGMLSSFGYHYLGNLSLVLIFVAIMIVLVFKPGGILGEVRD